MCLLVAVILVMGLCVFIYRDFSEGTQWATFQGNRDVYANGKLAKGALYDRHGDLLMRNTKDGMVFNDSFDVRAGCMHITGDKGNNIATGANRAFLDKLIGYDFINGIYALNNTGKDLYLTLDAGLCGAAYDAMEGHSGVVGIYNYQTGEILCLVSGPSYDPMDPPKKVENGTYINKFTSSTFAPGSTFKLVTSAAAIETLDDAYTYQFDCRGSADYGHGDKVTDVEAHGTVDLKEALEVSCNCFFGKLAEKIGGVEMETYTTKAGLLNSYDINGIQTAPGTFDFPEGGVNLAWTGIGQYHDMVNPCGMMVYVGSIANGGEAVIPYILDPRSLVDRQVSRITSRTETMIEPETAESLKEMMSNNVQEHYGGERAFPGLKLCAKTGTAEVEGQSVDNSWFVGFLDDEEHPYAFVVLIEKGGAGIDAAGSVANQVLQYAVGN